MTRPVTLATRQPLSRAIFAVSSLEPLSATMTSMASAPPWYLERATSTVSSRRGSRACSL